MDSQYKKLLCIAIIFILVLYPIWYGANWYAAGLVDQSKLIEFGMEEDFLYSNNWRPKLFYDNHKLSYIEFNQDAFDLEPFELDRNYKSELTLVQWVCRYGYSKILKKLITLGYDIEGKFPPDTSVLLGGIYIGEYSLLEISVMNDQPEIALMLIEHGAEYNTDELDDTLLHYAAESGSLNCLKLFIDKIPVNALNQWDITALYYAIENNNVDVAEFLLKNGADPEIPTLSGLRVLHLAVRTENPESVKMLLENGAKVNSLFNDKTALDLALLGIKEEHYIPDVSEEDKQKYEAIRQAKYIKIIDLLKEHGGEQSAKSPF